MSGVNDGGLPMYIEAMLSLEKHDQKQSLLATIVSSGTVTPIFIVKRLIPRLSPKSMARVRADLTNMRQGPSKPRPAR